MVGAFSTVPQDVIALVIQGVGGSVAAVAENAADSVSQANLVRVAPFDLRFFRWAERTPWHGRVLTLLLAAPPSSKVCMGHIRHF